MPGVRNGDRVAWIIDPFKMDESANQRNGVQLRQQFINDGVCNNTDLTSCQHMLWVVERDSSIRLFVYSLLDGN